MSYIDEVKKIEEAIEEVDLIEEKARLLYILKNARQSIDDLTALKNGIGGMSPPSTDLMSKINTINSQMLQVSPWIETLRKQGGKIGAVLLEIQEFHTAFTTELMCSLAKNAKFQSWSLGLSGGVPMITFTFGSD